MVFRMHDPPAIVYTRHSPMSLAKAFCDMKHDFYSTPMVKYSEDKLARSAKGGQIQRLRTLCDRRWRVDSRDLPRVPIDCLVRMGDVLHDFRVHFG